jgi:glycosidase
MSDFLIDDLEKFRDPLSLLYYDLEKKVNGADEKSAIQKAALLGRDRNRTPMQWSDEPHGGFCPPHVEPWLPVNPDFTRGINVKDQAGEPDSLINFYRRMLHVRKMNPALQTGEYREIKVANNEVSCYSRSNSQQELLVVLNMSDEPQNFTLPYPVNHILLSNIKNGVLVQDSSLTLQPYQGVIYSVS